jgi:hypothetical protein
VAKVVSFHPQEGEGALHSPSSFLVMEVRLP